MRGRTGCFHNGPGWSAPPRSSFRRTARQLLTEVEKKFAEATARAIAEIRLPIMGVLLFPEGDCSTAPPFLLPATRYPAAGGPRGDDASVRARHQNKILVRSSRGLRRDFHSADDLAEFALHVANDDRPVPVGAGRCRLDDAGSNAKLKLHAVTGPRSGSPLRSPADRRSRHEEANSARSSAE